jgi:type VI secretion system protein VasJ
MALAQFTDQVPKASDRAPLAAVEALFNEVDELLSSKLADAYEGMGAIRSLVRDKQRQLPAETPAQPANAPVAAPSTGQAPVAPAPASAQPASSGAMTAEVPSINSSADVLPALRTLGKGIVEAARHLRQAEPNSAMAYRIQREGVWLAVKQVPPAEGGKTKIPPPQAPDVSRLKGLFEGQQWAALANQAEELTGRFLFWLDLHRYVALGLDRQGANFQEAKDSVIQALLSFLRLHPGVLGLCFADGTPFADEATKAWIEEEMSKGGGGGAGGDGASSAQLDEEEQALRERFSAAREMVLGGKVAEGLKLAIQLSRRSPDARSRFRARLEAAQLALKGAKPEVARALLDGLFVEAETHGLEHWEPELCVQVYSALLKSRGGSAPENGGQLPSNDALLDRLARLDPAAALQAAG